MVIEFSTVLSLQSQNLFKNPVTHAAPITECPVFYWYVDAHQYSRTPKYEDSTIRAHSRMFFLRASAPNSLTRLQARAKKIRTFQASYRRKTTELRNWNVLSLPKSPGQKKNSYLSKEESPPTTLWNKCPAKPFEFDSCFGSRKQRETKILPIAPAHEHLFLHACPLQTQRKGYHERRRRSEENLEHFGEFYAQE